MDAPGSPRIIGVSSGPPWDRTTWSGIAYGLFSQLRDDGALVGAVAARPHAVDRLEQLGAVSRDSRLWRQRFFGSATRTTPLARAASDIVGSRRVRRLQDRADAVLQITAWLPLTHIDPRLVYAIFTDTTLALYLTRPDLRVDPAWPPVRRTRRFERQLFDRADVIFSSSAWAKRSMVADYGQDPAKVVTVGFGSNLPERPLCERAGGKRLLFVGQAFERKGGPMLLEAFRAVRRRHPEARLTVIGPVEPYAECDGVVWEGRLSREDPGERERLERAFDEADVFVMPSLYEPFAVVFLEAMSRGLPCVALDRAGVPEAVQDGVTGRLVAEADPAALAAALNDLLDDPREARRLGAAGHRRYRERFTWPAVSRAITAELALRVAAKRSDRLGVGPAERPRETH